jgi:asparagine synthase (glutamine-hydrolysing)
MLGGMCGIAGVAGAGATDVAGLERMAATMVHRGPDGQGTWTDGDVGLAFRRLAIIDLHDRSNQPLHLGSLHLVFNGEIYNYLELREELRGRGHRFVTDGDGEVLLHAWAEWGESALSRLNGMFAFAIWDAQTRQLTLATDRFAEKPLFFHRGQTSLVFASDVRALRARDPHLASPNSDVANRFLALGQMPVLPATFFADVERLPPSHLARWRPGQRLAIERWWTPRVVEVPSTPAAAAGRLRELLRESVALRLRSDVPVGTSLSGGLDSSAIVALISQLAPDHSRHAFTAAFRGFDRDEWSYAEQTAALAGVTRHHAVRPQEGELFRDLQALVADQEEPFASTSIYAQWRVMRAAREAGVIVLLDGQGADELLGGYPGIEGWILRERGIRSTLEGLVKEPRLAQSIALAYSAGRAPRAMAARHRLRAASPYVPPALAREAAEHRESIPDWIADQTPVRRELLTQAFCTSLPQLLRFADRDSMASSVEVRLPFLDPRVAEFALSLPAEMRWREGEMKPLLRDAVRGLVPAGVTARRDKVGFETPEAQWLSSEAGRAEVAEVLLSEPISETCVGSEIERDLSQGRWRDTGAVWRAVNLALWRAEWFGEDGRK